MIMYIVEIIYKPKYVVLSQITFGTYLCMTGTSSFLVFCQRMRMITATIPATMWLMEAAAPITRLTLLKSIDAISLLVIAW